jgi:hypothetical protein
MNVARRAHCRFPFSAVVSSLVSLTAAGPAIATHNHPGTANTIHYDLVQSFKQCGTAGNPVNAQVYAPGRGPIMLGGGTSNDVPQRVHAALR